MSETKEKKGWFSKLKDGLKKSSEKLTDGISAIVTKRKLDDEMLEELEELLITADIGVETAASATASLAKKNAYLCCIICMRLYFKRIFLFPLVLAIYI